LAPEEGKIEGEEVDLGADVDEELDMLYDSAKRDALNCDKVVLRVDGDAVS
jgi:hypothetical protein